MGQVFLVGGCLVSRTCSGKRGGWQFVRLLGAQDLRREREAGCWVGPLTPLLARPPLPPLPEASLHNPDPTWDGGHRLCSSQ